MIPEIELKASAPSTRELAGPRPGESIFTYQALSVIVASMALETDFVVIGSGVAGLRCSIELASSGARVTVLTKDKASESNTEYAQGGVAVVLAEDDDAVLHEEDTLVAGAGLCDERAVEILVSEGP